MISRKAAFETVTGWLAKDNSASARTQYEAFLGLITAGVRPENIASRFRFWSDEMAEAGNWESAIRLRDLYQLAAERYVSPN